MTSREYKYHKTRHDWDANYYMDMSKENGGLPQVQFLNPISEEQKRAMLKQFYIGSSFGVIEEEIMEAELVSRYGHKLMTK